MKINLAEVTEEGRNYVWSNQTGEINAVMADLIGKNPYSADFTIRRMTTKDYEMTGIIHTQVPEQCSRCGNDFLMPVDAKFREILIPKQDQPRNSKYAKVNHLSDIPEGEMDFCEYDGQHFEMGEYLHEVVALAEPFNPVCSSPECKMTDRSFDYNEEMPAEKPESPFAALKNLKLN